MNKSTGDPADTKGKAGESSASADPVVEMNSESKEIGAETSSTELDNRMSSRSFDDVSTENDTPTTLSYLFEENREDYLNFGVPLYEASLIGDWDIAKLILDARPDLVRFGLSNNLGTALHVASTAEETKLTLRFVNNLVNMMTREELELQNQYCNTAFWIAVSTGNVKMAVIMLEKNQSLLYVRGSGRLFPLSALVLWGHYNLTKYFYDNFQNMTGDHWTNTDRNLTLLNCVERDFFDVALQILNDHPDLVEDMSVLKILAQKPDAFCRAKRNLITGIIAQIFRFPCINAQPAAEEDTDALKLLKIFWTHASRTMHLNEIEDLVRGPPTVLADGTIQYSSRILFVAAETGNTRFIIELLRTYPDLMLCTNDDGLTIFHIAVKHRHQDIYNLLYEIGSMNSDICQIIDNTGNTMLHLVGKSSKEMASKSSGASLLMQRELLWFKEVEKMIPPYVREEKNNDSQSPYELFSQENEDLVSKGLKWMRDCMVVATLIITVAFAVAFTVPGGYKQDDGFPVFINERAFIVFVIANAISLFSSTTSLLVFLSILTSRHDQRDFMYSLPRKLMMGLLTLFISVAAMMMTFSASFFVLYQNGLDWVPILIATFASIPVIVFAVLQFPLLLDMFRSTYDSHYIFNPKKRMLYNMNQRLRSNCSPP